MIFGEESTHVHSGSAKLEVEVAGTGDGTPLIFLHAGVADRRMWRHQVATPFDGRRSLAYSRRGFGESSWIAEPFRHVDDLGAVLDFLGARQAILVGCSQGGRIAIDFALAHPKHVAALVLVSTAVSGAEWPEVLPPAIAALVAEFEEVDEGGDADALNQIEARVWLDGPLAAAGRVGGPIRDLFLEMNGEIIAHDHETPTGPEQPPPLSAVDRLSELECPTLVVSGDLDFPHIVEQSHRLATACSGKHVVIGNCAHMIPMEAHGQFGQLLADFARALPTS